MLDLAAFSRPFPLPETLLRKPTPHRRSLLPCTPPKESSCTRPRAHNARGTVAQDEDGDQNVDADYFAMKLLSNTTGLPPNSPSQSPTARGAARGALSAGV